MIGNGVGSLGSAWGDVRGTNGVIVAAPSDGGRYRWERPGPVPVLPDDLSEQLADSKPGPRGDGSGADAATDAEVLAFLAAHTTATRPGVLDGRVKGFTAKMGSGGRPNTPASRRSWPARWRKPEPLFSAQAALDALAPIFVTAAQTGAKRRSQRRARPSSPTWSRGRSRKPISPISTRSAPE